MTSAGKVPTLLTAGLALAVLLAGCQKPAEPAPAAGPAPAARPAGPRAACDAPAHDFGAILQGEMPTHAFSLRNEGDAPLQIKHISSSCGATVKKPEEKVIPPGGTAVVELGLDTTGIQGPVKKHVVVHTNDPGNRRVDLRVTATVEVLAGFDPGRLKVRNLLKGTRSTHQVKLIGRELGRLRLQDLRPSDPKALSATPATVDGRPALEVGFQAGDRPGRFEGEIVAGTGLPSLPEIRLPVVFDVTGDLVLDQEEVDFGLVTPKRPVFKQVRISSLGGKPFAVKEARDPTGRLAVGVSRSGDQVVLDLEAREPGEEPTGAVHVRTDRKDQPELVVPYRVRLLRLPTPTHLKAPEKRAAPSMQPAPAPSPATR